FEKGIWFYDAPLGRYTYEKMIREICQNMGVVNMNYKKIINHSIKRSAIQILTQLNVATDRIMAFSGHRSIGEVTSYQTFTKEIMNSTVSMIIPNQDSDKEYSRNTSNSNFDEDVPDSALVEGAPKIIVKNCKNCNIDINVAFNK
ncbi:11899_t:CDS:2, partial [Gigaspora margarita]